MWNVFWNARRKVEYSAKPACSAACITGHPWRISSPASSSRSWRIYWRTVKAVTALKRCIR